MTGTVVEKMSDYQKFVPQLREGEELVEKQNEERQMDAKSFNKLKLSVAKQNKKNKRMNGDEFGRVWMDRYE